MIAERLGLDRHLEIVAEALAALGGEIIVVGLGRTEDAEAHG